MAREHAEVITAGGWMVPALAVGLLAGLGLVASGVSLLSGWALALTVAFGALVALTAIGSLGFFLWGRYLGFGWHFTR